jgi:predicted RND superfamily exporter protein
MKNITNTLMPLAALAIFAACLIAALGFLVVLMTSIGFAGALPLDYYQRLNVGIISVALPAVGMILVSIIMIGFQRKPAKAAKPIVIDDAKNPTVSEEGKMEENLAQAA